MAFVDDNGGTDGNEIRELETDGEPVKAERPPQGTKKTASRQIQERRTRPGGKVVSGLAVRRKCPQLLGSNEEPRGDEGNERCSGRLAGIGEAPIKGRAFSGRNFNAGYERRGKWNREHGALMARAACFG
jgi:hypothetical protein